MGAVDRDGLKIGTESVTNEAHHRERALACDKTSVSDAEHIARNHNDACPEKVATIFSGVKESRQAKRVVGRNREGVAQAPKQKVRTQFRAPSSLPEEGPIH